MGLCMTNATSNFGMQLDSVRNDREICRNKAENQSAGSVAAIGAGETKSRFERLEQAVVAQHETLGRLLSVENEKLNNAVRTVSGLHGFVTTEHEYFHKALKALNDMASLSFEQVHQVIEDLNNQINEMQGMLLPEAARSTLTADELAARPEFNGRWRCLGRTGTPWTPGYKIRGIAPYRGGVVVTLAGTDIGEVWHWCNETWQPLAHQLDVPWHPGDHPNGIIEHDDILYVAVAGEKGGVYAYKDNRFERLGEACMEFPEFAGLKGVYSIVHFAGDIWVGCDFNAEIYRYQDGLWQRMAGAGEHGSWDPSFGYGNGYCLIEQAGMLYCGIALPASGKLPAPVWRYDPTATPHWQKVTPHRTGEDWVSKQTVYVLDFALLGDTLATAVTRPRLVLGTTPSLFGYSNGKWRALGKRPYPKLMSESQIWNSLTDWRGHLIVGCGDVGRKMASVWLLDKQSDKWVQLGGDGCNGSWESDNASFMAEKERTGGQWVYSIKAINDRIYAGFAGYHGGAELWEYST